jgi:hypothetical protein
VRRTLGVLKKATTNLIKAVKEMGLAINMHKTKYIEVTKRPTNMRLRKVDEWEF